VDLGFGFDEGPDFWENSQIECFGRPWMDVSGGLIWMLVFFVHVLLIFKDCSFMKKREFFKEIREEANNQGCGESR
jgi:hypothetical protein